MKGMVFAAGLGTRLRPLTNDMPKALVKVGQVPMLERVIRKMAAAGIGPVVVNAHHFADKVEEFVRGRDFGVPVSLSREDGADALETGGGIRHAAPLLKGGGRFLVHNVDILSDVSLPWFISQDDPGALATLLLVDRPADRKLLFIREDGGPPGEARTGLLRMVGWTNTVTGQVRSPYAGLDPADCIQLSFCGIQILSEEVFPLMASWPERFGIIDFYISECASHLIRGVVADRLNLIDIGTPETLAEANARAEEFK